MKHIRRLLTVTIPILAISVLYMLLLNILPIFGVHLCITNTGESMEPNMHWGAFSVWVEPSVAPFDELEAGDIIIYRERKQVISSGFTINNTIKGSTTTPTVTPASTPTPLETESREVVVAYIPGKYAEHRVIEVRGNEVYTMGDGNGGDPDNDPVISSGYVGKVVWYVNYLGRVFQVLCSPWCFSILSGLTAALLMLKKLLSAQASSTPPSSTSTPPKK